MKSWKLAASAVVGLLAAGAAGAQDKFPTKVVTIVVPFAAGGPTDTVARLVGQAMSADLGQQVLVENVGGAGGTLGAGRVVKAAPDGHTLLLHHIGQATAPALYRKLAYDPLKDFAPIGLVTNVPMTLVARGNFPAEDVKGVVAYVKANPDKVSYGNAGLGSASHLCGMLFQQAIATPIVTVAYKGTGPAMNDLLGGQIDLMCDQTTNTTGQIKGKQIKAYGVTTPERVASLPGLPPLAESGLKGMEVGVWHGLYGPKGTPQPVVDRLAASLQKALKDPTVVARFTELGTAPEPADRATPAALQAHLAAEIARWTPIIKAAGEFAE